MPGKELYSILPDGTKDDTWLWEQLLGDDLPFEDEPVPATLGSRGSGNFGHAGRPGEVGGSSATHKDGKLRNERSLRALKSAVPTTKKTQRLAEKNEILIADMVKGVHTPDNHPVDVLLRMMGKLFGIEVKTLQKNKNDKITMRKAAVERKHKWALENRGTVHVVVIDDRPAHLNGGHRFLYTRTIGSPRISGMTKIRSAAHLRALLREK